MKLQEAALYAIAALVKDNSNIALVLSKSTSEQKCEPSAHLLIMVQPFLDIDPQLRSRYYR